MAYRSDVVLYTQYGDFFEIAKVKELQPDDFYLGSRTPTMLKSRSPTMIMFYLPTDPTSQEMKDVWAALATTVSGIDYCAVNAANAKQIMKAFLETGTNIDHPLWPFRVEGFPTIMMYRDGWPQAFYNGDRTFDELLAYSLELAAKPGYYEPFNDYVGVAPGNAGLYAYERRLPGSTKSDYIEQLEEAEPLYTPDDEPGVALPVDLIASDDIE